MCLFLRAFYPSFYLKFLYLKKKLLLCFGLFGVVFLGCFFFGWVVVICLLLLLLLLSLLLLLLLLLNNIILLHIKAVKLIVILYFCVVPFKVTSNIKKDYT